MNNETSTLQEMQQLYYAAGGKNTITTDDFYGIIEGLPKRTKEKVMAAIELYKICRGYKMERSIIHSSQDGFSLLRCRFEMLDHEECHAVFLNTAGRVVATECIGKGGWAGTPVDIKMILQKALKHKATGIILAHNHPSGSLRPSRQDDTLTQNLKESCKIIGIKLIDHLVITDTAFYSYADEGRL